MVIDIILNAFSSLLLLYNAENIIAIVEGKKFRFKISFLVIIYILSNVAFWSSIFDFLPVTMNLLALIIMYVSLILRVCRGKSCKFSKALYILMLYLSVDSLVVSVFKILLGIANEYFYTDNAIVATISAIVTFTAIKITERKKPTFETEIIPNYIYILILLAVFFSGGLVEGLSPAWKNLIVGIFFARFSTVILLVILMIVIISLVFNCISKAYLQNTSSLLEKQVETQIEYYEKIGNLNNDLRSFRHDYKNHLICIGSLIDKKEYDEAREYIEKISGMNINTSKEFFSGNTIANAILNDKSEKADKSDIKIDFDGYIHKGISPTDICIILSNAIDNAIEACEKISGDEDRKISVNCSYSKGVQIISIKNPVPENVEIEDDSVKTSKEDKSIHGIGLYNIRNTVKKYGGEFNISCENKEFTLSVAFMPDTEDITS